MKIISWNVNGIRAVLKKWFAEWVATENPDVLCLQEVKAFEHQCVGDVSLVMPGYEYVRHAWTRPWYAWTATFWKKWLPHTQSIATFDASSFHEDGRVVQTDFEDISLLNCYFPNGWTRADWTEMLSYKLAFYDELTKYCDMLQSQWQHVIVGWDFNIAHTENDLARPKENQNSIGFLPIERARIWEFFDSWYIDTFRKFVPDWDGHYTRRAYRAGARPRNVWRRIDYFAVSKVLENCVAAMQHMPHVMGSDHCPIYIDIK